MSGDGTPAHRQRAAGGRRRTVVLILIGVLVVAAGVIIGVVRWHNAHHDAAPRLTVAPTEGAGANAATTGNATFEVPGGFASGKAYRPATALYTPYGGTYLRLDSAGTTVQLVAVIVYKLPATSVPKTDAARLDFVKAVDRRVSATVIRASRIVTVASHPAVTQDGIQVATAAGRTGRYDYRTWYVFGPSSTLLQVACQWSTQRSAILTGCQQVVQSMRFQ